MERDSSVILSPLERVPPELLGLVLTSLPDLRSLQKATLSCPAIHHAFTIVKSTAPTQIVFRQIHHEVLPEAVAAHESSFLPSQYDELRGSIFDFVERRFSAFRRPDPTRYDPYRQDVVRFSENHLRIRRNVGLTQSWLFDQLLRMESFHLLVTTLAREFAMSALAKLKNASYAESHGSTPSEIRRFERAFYRYEIWCNLFRENPICHPILSGTDQQRLFFLHFSPWENEQLLCIQDFLFRSILPAYNEVAEHDVVWGHFVPTYPGERDDDQVQGILGLGLDMLYRISKAKTYDQRQKLLKFRRGPPERREKFRRALGSLFTNFQYDNCREEYGPTGGRFFALSPFFEDPDSGPESMWRWAYFIGPKRMGFTDREHHYLHARAYVMWDRSRLDALGVMREPFDTPETESSPHAPELSEDQVRKSYLARSKIWRNGGRGWWDFGDVSQIVWTGELSEDWTEDEKWTDEREINGLL